MYRYILYDEHIPDITKRPTLFEMSWPHHKDCDKDDSPKGIWNCSELSETYFRLNKVYHFTKGYMDKHKNT